MRSFYKLLSLAGLALASTSATASSTNAGYVTNISSFREGHILFNAGDRYSLEGCQTRDYPRAWALDTSTAAGQSLLSVFLSAYALHKQIQVNGSGVCDVHASVETVSSIGVLD